MSPSYRCRTNPNYKGRPQTSQSVPPRVFWNVQYWQTFILDPPSAGAGSDEVPLVPLAAASSAAIWSNTSAGMSKSSGLESMGIPPLELGPERARNQLSYSLY